MTRPRGWWRRNAVALVALLPVLAAGAWLTGDDFRDRVLDHGNHRSAGPAADGWITLRDSSFRVDSFQRYDPATDTENYLGPVTLPAGSTAWQLRGTLRTSEQTPNLCGLSVQASDGLSYAAGPREFAGGSFGDCVEFDTSDLPEDTGQTGAADGTGTGAVVLDGSKKRAQPVEVTGTAVFLMPSDAAPQQLRIADTFQAPVLGVADIGG